MPDPKNISILDYTYELPDNRIALHPLPERDASKLLIYQDDQISESTYRHIAEYISAQSTLVFNNTRVINARLHFNKATGGHVEIFCLEPAGELPEYQTVMNRSDSAQWYCLVGNAAKWKDEVLHKKIGLSDGEDVILNARKLTKEGDYYLVEFSWTPAALRFAEILDMAGEIPLPPYIKRSAIREDKERYQTIYAEEEGSVAAPTAGLHFTQHVFESLDRKGIEREYVTLHVGAGTFRPVKASTMAGHDMHAEWIDVSAETLRKLMQVPGKIIAVGTTSLRTLESLYWLGVKAQHDPQLKELTLHQWDVYEQPLMNTDLSLQESFRALLHWMDLHQRKNIFTQTQLLIAPGYRFRVVSGLITNFHQPQSTLLLLVAAAVGDKWRDLYQYALDHDYRFLSYGDGSYLSF